MRKLLVVALSLVVASCVLGSGKDPYPGKIEQGGPPTLQYMRLTPFLLDMEMQALDAEQFEASAPENCTKLGLLSEEAWGGRDQSPRPYHVFYKPSQATADRCEPYFALLRQLLP